MVSITSWMRLEPRCRDEQMRDGLQATVHDPLWLLARQWQLGEFAAHDGGAVVTARIQVECAPLTRYRPGPADCDAEAHRYDTRKEPLEAVVEGEAPQEAAAGPADLRAAAEAGLRFAQMLRHHGVGDYTDAYRQRYPIEPADDTGGREPGDDVTRFLAVVAGRGIDGARLYDDLAGQSRTSDGAVAELPADPPIADGDRDTVAAVAGRWLDRYERLHGAPDRPPSAWVPERMTHRFAASAATSDGELVLEAPEHPGGRLDWYAFDHAPDAALRNDSDEADEQPREIVTTTLPSPVHYRGMPTSRWWEMEDARADFGSVETGPEDLARMLFVDLAITYGNDWLLIPVEVDAGSLCRIRSLVVTDTFGRRTLIRHHADVDESDAWRMFRLSRRDAAGDGHPADRTLLVAPTLPGSPHGPRLEEVLLRRDNIANLAWAIERTVPGALGNPLDRTATSAGGTAGTDEERDPQAPYVYRLATDVPDHWFPLVPVPGDQPGSVRLVRGRMRTAEGEPPAQPWGTLLRPGERLALFDEEVPRAGVRVTRRDERARWSDGSTHQWRARRAFVGGGEAWSGLRYDIVEPS